MAIIAIRKWSSKYRAKFINYNIYFYGIVFVAGVRNVNDWLPVDPHRECWRERFMNAAVGIT